MTSLSVILIGAMMIVAYRGFMLKQTLWDLMILVIVSSVLATAYQAVHKIFERRVIVGMVVLGVICFLLASALALLLPR